MKCKSVNQSFTKKISMRPILCRVYEAEQHMINISIHVEIICNDLNMDAYIDNMLLSFVYSTQNWSHRNVR